MELSFYRKWMTRFLILIGLGLFVDQANAIFFVEPLVSYDSETLSANTAVSNAVPISIDESGKSTGFSYGARLGYHFGFPMFIAAEYLGASDNYKPNTPNQSGITLSNTTATGTAISALIGFHVNRFRFIFGYSPSDALTLKGTGGSSDAKFTGTSVKAGIGIWLHRHVTLEVDYVVPNYTKVDPGTGAVTTSSLYSKFDANIIRAGLTFPIFF